jgi:hypothetical protein
MDIEAKIAKNVTLRTLRLSVSCRTVLAYFSFDLTQPKYHIVMLVSGISDYCAMLAVCVCVRAHVCVCFAWLAVPLKHVSLGGM